MTLRRLPAITLIPLLALGACGESKPTADDSAAVRAAMVRWAETTRAEDACAQISRGFKLFLSEGRVDLCTSRLPEKLTLSPQKIVIKRVRFEDHQALVDAVPVGHPKDANTWYFIKVGAGWQLNSIGINVGPPEPGGPPDPPADVLVR